MKYFYRPWLGEEYQTAADYRRRLIGGDPPTTPYAGRGLPIHIMGESHYGEPYEHEPGNTERIIKICALRQALCSGLFTKLAKMVLRALGEPLESDFRADTWQRLAFSNYVQDLLPKSRKKPEQGEWVRGHEAFFDQLRTSAPAILVVFGWRTWQHLPLENSILLDMIDPVSADGAAIPESRAYTYRIGDVMHCTHAIGMAHPSGSGFKTAEAAARLKTALLVQCAVRELGFDFERPLTHPKTRLPQNPTA